MISSYIMPAFIALIIVFGMVKRVPVFEKFTEGAKEGLRIIAALTPTLVGLLTAVAMFNSSGAVDFMTAAIKPVLTALSIPPDIVPLVLLRPVSGSGSLSILSGIFEKCGPDSLVAKMASVIMSSTETTFYTIAVYFGACGIKKSGYTLPAALCADLTGFILGITFVNILFNN